jgi:hypothetical protein
VLPDLKHEAPLISQRGFFSATSMSFLRGNIRISEFIYKEVGADGLSNQRRKLEAIYLLFKIEI